MVDRPWLPGSYPMPQPFVWRTDDGAPGVGEHLADPRASTVVPPFGSNIVGLPMNIVKSLLSCIEGENRMRASVDEYWGNVAALPTPVNNCG